jgi:hypothetical protein
VFRRHDADFADGSVVSGRHLQQKPGVHFSLAASSNKRDLVCRFWRNNSEQPRQTRGSQRIATASGSLVFSARHLPTQLIAAVFLDNWGYQRSVDGV